MISTASKKLNCRVLFNFVFFGVFFAGHRRAKSDAFGMFFNEIKSSQINRSNQIKSNQIKSNQIKSIKSNLLNKI